VFLFDINDCLQIVFFIYYLLMLISLSFSVTGFTFFLDFLSSIRNRFTKLAMNQ